MKSSGLGNGPEKPDGSKGKGKEFDDPDTPEVSHEPASTRRTSPELPPLKLEIPSLKVETAPTIELKVDYVNYLASIPDYPMFAEDKIVYASSLGVKSIDAYDDEGLHLLHQAIIDKDIPKLIKLLDAGANIRAKVINYKEEGRDRTAEPRRTLGMGGLDTLELLTQLKARDRSYNKVEAAILKYAIDSNNPSLLKFLIFNGIDLNAEDKDGKNIIHEALDNPPAEAKESTDLLQALTAYFTQSIIRGDNKALMSIGKKVSQCFDFHLPTPDSFKKHPHNITQKYLHPLSIAILTSNDRIIANIFRSKPKFDPTVDNPLNHAFNLKRHDIFFALLNAVDETMYRYLRHQLLSSKSGRDLATKVVKDTALMNLVIAKKDWQFLEYLRECGGYPSFIHCLLSNYKNPINPGTPLIYSAPIRDLLPSNASLDVPNKEGKTLLHEAIVDKDIRMIKWLLENGANPNFPDADGNTPLHYAAIYSKMSTDRIVNLPEMIHILLCAKGINLDLVNKEGKHAWEVANPGIRDYVYTRTHPSARWFLHRIGWKLTSGFQIGLAYFALILTVGLPLLFQPIQRYLKSTN